MSRPLSIFHQHFVLIIIYCNPSFAFKDICRVLFIVFHKGTDTWPDSEQIFQLVKVEGSFLLYHGQKWNYIHIFLAKLNPSTLWTHRCAIFVAWNLMDKEIYGCHKFGRTRMRNVFNITSKITQMTTVLVADYFSLNIVL